MNLTDLRDELATRADDLAAAPDLTTAVADRVRTVKRRRVVAAGSVATLTAAALAVGVLTSVGRPAPVVPAASPSSTGPMIGADGMPYRTVPDAPGDVVKDGLRFREQVGEDRLAAGAIGDLGQNSLVLSWRPVTTHVSYAAECYLPGATPDLVTSLRVRVAFGGSAGFFESGCSSQAPQTGELPSGGASPGEQGKGDPSLVTGRPASVRVELVDGAGKLVTRTDARIVGAVYELGGETSLVPTAGGSAAVVPNVREYNGYTYVLADSSTTLAKDLTTRPLELRAPASGPFLVTYGTVGSGAWTSNPGFLTVAGLDGDASLVQEGGLATDPQAHAHGQLLRLERAEGAAPRQGTGVIATYVLAK